MVHAFAIFAGMLTMTGVFVFLFLYVFAPRLDRAGEWLDRKLDETEQSVRVWFRKRKS